MNLSKWLGLMLILSFSINLIAQNDILSVKYGPPAQADTWVKYTIPLVAQTFGVENAVFEASMKNITLIRIQTEMSNSKDKGGLDSIKLGDGFIATFDNSAENWNAMGDGTMYWEQSGGVNGGYITVEDWASGIEHWAAAPASWSGDLSQYIGQSLTFYYKTNYPDYKAVIEFYTSVMGRIILTAGKQTLSSGETTQLVVSLSNVPKEDVTVNLTSSNSGLISLPASVTIHSGENSFALTIEALQDISEGDKVVITATAAGYETTRLTITGNKTIKIPEILSVGYGPPAQADTWIKYTIPLVAQTFGLDDAVYEASMKNITLIRIQTEMSNSKDKGGLDSITLGDGFIATFDNSAENWNAMGDGTMYWEQSGGVNGGYITVEDWASGIEHWAAAPASWSGDLSQYIGQSFTFYYKTNYPDYSAVVEFYTGVMGRIILTAGKQALSAGETTQLVVRLSNAPKEDVTLNLTSSNSRLISLPASVTIHAGEDSSVVSIEASQAINEGDEVVITASASGYETTRVTITLSNATAVFDYNQPVINIFPNPTNGCFKITMDNNINDNAEIAIYSIIGQLIYSSDYKFNRNEIINLGDYPKGIYTVKIITGSKISFKRIMLK